MIYIWSVGRMTFIQTSSRTPICEKLSQSSHQRIIVCFLVESRIWGIFNSQALRNRKYIWIFCESFRWIETQLTTRWEWCILLNFPLSKRATSKGWHSSMEWIKTSIISKMSYFSDES